MVFDVAGNGLEFFEEGREMVPDRREVHGDDVLCLHND